MVGPGRGGYDKGGYVWQCRDFSFVTLLENMDDGRNNM